MTKQEMMTAVIRKYGFEHEDTIWFFKKVEQNVPFEELTATFEVVMNEEED